MEKNVNTSNKNYIDDHNEIDVIITQLLSIKAIELAHDEDTKMLLIRMLESSMRTLRISTKQKCEVTIGEMLDIFDELKYEPYITYDKRDICKEIRMMLASDLKNILLSAEDLIPVIKRFMSVSVKSCLDYFAIKDGWTGIGIHNLYRKLRGPTIHYLRDRIEENTTIGEFFRGTAKFQHSGWKPVDSIRNYEYNIMCSYEGVAYFWFDCFRVGFPELFDLSKIEEKYGAVPRKG